MMSNIKQLFIIENLVEIFDLINTTGQKEIMITEMKTFFNRYGKIQQEKVKEMFKAMDYDKKETISKEAFVFYLLKHGIFTNQ